jgi:xanthine dehydrogenase small subunit
MTQFILNKNLVRTDLPSGTLLLDYIRYHKRLTGTKIGCREGDCGACTVLIGELIDGELRYRSATSCLTPIGNANGKHIVTVEGVNLEDLNPIQQAMCDEGATQCGFCTPGFVVSLAGFCLNSHEHNIENAISAIDGNICRCTGYKSIERAAKKVSALMQENKNEDPVLFTTQHKILPEYFATIKERLQELKSTGNIETTAKKLVGGGTDLYVQKPDEMPHEDIHFTSQNEHLKGIAFENNTCILGASTTVADLIHSAKFNEYFPDFKQHAKLVSSTPIRNIATLAGNFVNASPIGDFTIFFLALNAKLLLSDGENRREIYLKDFYKGYKMLDKSEAEFVEKISFKLPDKNTLFNFEKVSKRTHLDIASVNSAICLQMENDKISSAVISVGGVGPIPLTLQKASSFLIDKSVDETVILECIDIAQTEIAPISDTRGSSEYKRLLLRQLILVHFHQLFPEIQIEKLVQYL